MGAESTADVLIQGIGDGNRIVVNNQGGVITVFGDADKGRLFQEIYQLESKEAQDLAQLLHKHDPLELVKHIPAPKLVDMSVAMTRGEMSYRQFLNHKEDFELNSRYMEGFRLKYGYMAKNSDVDFSEPKDADTFNREKDGIVDWLEGKRVSMSAVEAFNKAIGNEAEPLEVKQVDSTHIPGVSVF